MDEQKTEKIKQRRRSLREEYAKSKTGKTQELRYMNFLKEILTNLGLNFLKLSKLAGLDSSGKERYSQPRINWWMIKDDCRLSTLQDVLSYAGVSLTCSYKARNAIKKDYRIQYEGLPAVMPAARSTKDVLYNALSKEMRLTFLAEFIISTGMTKLKSFCDGNDIEYMYLYRDFRADDITVQRIYYVAEKTGAEVIWKVSKLDDTTNGANK